MINDIKCKRCGSEKIVKNGIANGEQQYLCKNCRHQFISELDRYNKHDEQIVITLYCYGMSFRTIASIMFVNYTTVYRWVKRFAERNLANPVSKSEIIIDHSDICSFLEDKKRNCTFNKCVRQHINSVLVGSAKVKVPIMLAECLLD